MEFEDTIALIYPASGPHQQRATEAIKLPQNSSRFVPPQKAIASSTQQKLLLPPAGQSDRRIRQDTPEPSQEPQGLEYKPCLRLTFSNGPKSHLGFLAGSNPNSDIVLPQMGGVSYNHLAFRFNGDHFCVVDRDSTFGTVVKYNESEDLHPRSGVQWIIGGHPFLSRKEFRVIVRLAEDLQFQVVVPVRSFKLAHFKEKIAELQRGKIDTEAQLQAMNLTVGPKTQQPSASQTPGRDHVLLKTRIGQGGFAYVDHVWNSGNGIERVEKYPKLPSPGKTELWRQEANMMNRTSHERIVKFYGFVQNPVTTITLEFLPGGSLQEQLSKNPSFTPLQCRQVTWQISDALAYLHGLHPRIVVRDVSSGNILVHYRSRHEISVKLADFGLAKDTMAMHTVCGNPWFMAPEIASGPRSATSTFHTVRSYSPAVDIFSLGTTIVHMMRCLPKWTGREEAGAIWCQRIRAQLEQHYQRTNDDLTSFLLEEMVTEDPIRRASAQRCYTVARRLADKVKAVLLQQPPGDPPIGAFRDAPLFGGQPPEAITKSDRQLLRHLQPELAKEPGWDPSKDPPIHWGELSDIFNSFDAKRAPEQHEDPGSGRSKSGQPSSRRRAFPNHLDTCLEDNEIEHQDGSEEAENLSKAPTTVIGPLDRKRTRDEGESQDSADRRSHRTIPNTTNSMDKRPKSDSVPKSKGEKKSGSSRHGHGRDRGSKGG